MATCYDCIHCDACSDAGDGGYSSLKEDASKCKHFKNKADYAEVKHGYWKYYNHLYECSVCGREALYKPYSDELGHTKARQELTPVCPYCSAKNGWEE